MTMYLYRKVRQSVTLATAIAICSLALPAQFRAPLPERKTPRAVAVLETFKNGSRRLVPVTFFYERHYYDATFYHATPVPFTLYSETVYEVQQFGKTLGTFTVQSATQNEAAWFGNGRYRTAPDAATLARKNAPRPIVLEDPFKPVLHRRPGSEGDNPVTHSAAAATAPEAENDPDRPRLHRRDGSGDGKNAPSASAAPPATITATPMPKAELTPSEDPDHPILRRGKPVREQSGANLPDFKKEEPVTRQVAVSDAGPSEAQPLIYLCPEEERRHLEAAARELALAELRRLAMQRGIMLPAAKAQPAQAKAGAQAKKKSTAPEPSPELKLAEEQFVPYDLDYNNYATVVFSARYAPEVATATGAAASSTDVKASGEATAGATGKSWLVTVIARQDGDKLIKLYSAVSDPRELDLYPEVRLVDAVDPDGYGRYALLFRLRKRDGVSWLLGRVTGYELQTVFETAVR
jgi:hypothetical protein